MTEAAFEVKVQRIRENFQQVHTRMEQAAQKAGRDVREIQLVAVTKLLPLETIKAGIAAGIRAFGENYPEQAAEKVAALKSEGDLTWHMIGHIQSRKSNTVCTFFDWVHSVDRLKIAQYLDRYCREAGKKMPILIEVNLSGEESKFGWKAWNEDCWLELVPQFEKIDQLSNVEIHGLMSMPPYFDDPELTRPYYQRLKRLQGYLRGQMSGVAWDELSIGTSFDYEIAIEEGATIVRLGTTIFGPRPEK